LATLQDAESIDAHDSSFMPETEVQRCLMFTHARLAKLLAENGQTQASTNHIAAALKYAQETINAPEPMRRFSSVTNQVKLFEVLDEFDKRGLP
jgi:hypothetical protein